LTPRKQEIFKKLEKTPPNILPVQKLAVPLHSLSGSDRGCGLGGLFLPASPELKKLDL
jgi:hypothetical protein